MYLFLNMHMYSLLGYFHVMLVKEIECLLSVMWYGFRNSSNTLMKVIQTTFKLLQPNKP